MAKIQLPSIITEDCWFYKANKELCEPHLGKPYISNSSIDSWENYQEDFIKQKFIGIKLPDGLYAKLGNYVGEAVENGEFGDNEFGFTGQENLDLSSLRPKGAEYEKMILIDMGEYVIIGFIDVFHEYEKNVVHVRDMKTGGKKKEDKYSSKDYIQVILYARAIEQMGYEIGKTDVYFIRRTGSHINPPLNISKEQFEIPLEYDEKRVDFALKKVDKIVKEISSVYTTYQKIFGS